MAFDKDEANFVKGKIEYKGSKILSQFTFEDIGLQTDGELVTVTVTLKRICWFYLYTMFIPSLCIVFTAQLTLFVSEV